MVVDLGSGTLVDLRDWGLPHEVTVRETIDAGADIVTFSGDKLLGGPQAGIIVGKKELIARSRRTPQARPARGQDHPGGAGAHAAPVPAPEKLAQKLTTLRLFTRPQADMQAPRPSTAAHAAAGAGASWWWRPPA
jgi:L-seryl-tRNA(Ser) seleniumtransferase